MKKKSFGLAAAVAVLMVLGGSYALLANHNRIQESESAAAESETGVAVATIASDKVSSFQLAGGDTSFTLTKTDNSWICVQDETFPLSNDAASELVNTFTSLQAVRDLGTAQDGENYGFSENAPTVTLTSSDSTNCSFVLGEANSMTGDYYLKREDSGEIYTVSSSLADSFHKTLTDLAEIESFPTISSDNVQELSITEEVFCQSISIRQNRQNYISFVRYNCYDRIGILIQLAHPMGNILIFIVRLFLRSIRNTGSFQNKSIFSFITAQCRQVNFQFLL